MLDTYREYIIQVKKNAKALAAYLLSKDYKLCTGGTDNHLLLVDLKNKGISGSKAEYVCECVDISLNKNSVYGDSSALNPGGIRIGTCALTTRGLNEADFEKVGYYIDSVITLCQKIQNISGKKIKDFKDVLHKDFQNELDVLKAEINEIMEGYDFILD